VSKLSSLRKIFLQFYTLCNSSLNLLSLTWSWGLR